MPATKRELKKFVKQLERIKGRHTELVTVYVPSGYDLNKIISHLGEEQGTAKNIKDAKTRGNVIDSLERCIRHLRLYKRTPENGLGLFAGNVAAQEGKVDIQVWSIEPPEPLKTRMYRCDQTFVLDILKGQMEHKEVYGLIVMDRREGTLGLLKGPNISVIGHLTSGVPGKFKAGGQCLSPDTLLMLDDGDVVQMKNIHNPHLVLSENLNKEETEPTPVIAKWENEKELFRVTTCYPKFTIESSQEHTFFVRTINGIEEKPLSDLKEGDYLVMPEKINLCLEDQPIDFSPEVKRSNQMKSVNIPKKITPDIARIFGYYLGDGSYEFDRLTFFEQREEVAKFYKKLIEKTFNLPIDLRFRKSKNYHQLRVYSRVLTQFFSNYIKKGNKSLSETIPRIILTSSNSCLASFIAGFFDAEGYVTNGRMGLGINNQILAKQLQLCLLRLGILSSLLEYDNRRNPYSDNIRYTVAIDDIESMKNFQKLIGFASKEKNEKLISFIQNRSNRNKVRQLVANGSDVARILRNAGLKTRDFGAPLFFVNKRQMSKELFKNKILEKIGDLQLKKRLELFYSSNLIAVKIKSITPLSVSKTVDIETKNHNFLANGILVHNSAQRFHRLIEGMALEFYRRIADLCNKEFLGMKNLKGIIVGGPGPTKNSFIEQLNEELKRKIIAVQDITYTDESGLTHVVEKSQDILSDEILIQEKKAMNRFFEMLAKDTGRVAYGKDDVKEKLTMGAVELLLISEDVDDKLCEEFEDLAKDYSTEVLIISTHTAEGKQLFDMGGFGAVLRYSM